MNKLSILAMALFIFACDTGKREQDTDEDTTAVNEEIKSPSEEKVLFACDSTLNSGQFTLAILMESYNEAIPVDTVTRCEPVNLTQHRKYFAPENVNGLAIAGDYVYYTYTEKDQLVIMRSKVMEEENDTIQYELHMSVPLEPMINEGDSI